MATSVSRWFAARQQQAASVVVGFRWTCQAFCGERSLLERLVPDEAVVQLHRLIGQKETMCRKADNHRTLQSLGDLFQSKLILKHRSFPACERLDVRANNGRFNSGVWKRAGIRQNAANSGTPHSIIGVGQGDAGNSNLIDFRFSSDF
ncbi:MAG: hypothetical protein R3C49_23175 [Planctomycetaceae bacterium]